MPRGIATCGDLRQWALTDLEEAFGSFGRSLYNRARGVDERPVEPDQQVQSISSEDTFAEDLLLEDLGEAIVQLAEKTWKATRKTERVGHTVVLKLKTAQFRILTRSFTPERPPESMEELRDIALALRARVDLPAETRYRLVGVGLGGFREKEPVVQGECSSTDHAVPTNGRHPPTAAGSVSSRKLSKAGGAVAGREPHGCGDRAYMDVLAASPQPDPPRHPTDSQLLLLLRLLPLHCSRCMAQLRCQRSSRVARLHCLHQRRTVLRLCRFDIERADVVRSEAQCTGIQRRTWRVMPRHHHLRLQRLQLLQGLQPVGM